jgi:hypothetical protein
MIDNDSRTKVMEAITASLKSFCRLELPFDVYIDLALNSVDIDDAIEEARAGNKDARERMRHLASCYLSSDDFGPMPAALRQYAAWELERLNKGIPDPIRPAGGRPPRAYRNKLIIAHWIYKAIKRQGMSQSGACSAYLEHVSENDLSVGPLEKLCKKLLPDIDALYQKVSEIRATVVPIRVAR